MKIAQIAPLAESCPPRLYGGTERVVANLTNELVMLGHDVTLFASGDSQTLAELDAPCERALRLSPRHRDPLAYLTIQLGRVVRRAHEFDALHFHLDYPHFPAVAGFAERVLTTQHGRLDLPDLAAVIREFPSQAMVSISESQRQPLPRANWVATVYHGIPTTMHQMGDGSGGYLAFLGRICPEKGVERAIAIAERTQVPLRLAAKVDRVDAAYFASTIKPLLHDPLVAHVGEIGDREKTRFLGDARALLFPIDWPEPFGLVMIEAMACGTPVIAFKHGAVPEIIQDGVTGFIVTSEAEAVDALNRVQTLDRKKIRAQFEARFTAQRMAQDYVNTYELLLLPKEQRLRLVQ